MLCVVASYFNNGKVNHSYLFNLVVSSILDLVLFINIGFFSKHWDLNQWSYIILLLVLFVLEFKKYYHMKKDPEKYKGHEIKWNFAATLIATILNIFFMIYFGFLKFHGVHF